MRLSARCDRLAIRACVRAASVLIGARAAAGGAAAPAPPLNLPADTPRDHRAQDRGGRRGRQAEGLLAADGRSDLQLRRAGLPGSRDASSTWSTILKKNGFTVEEGVAGIPTAFMATWGSGQAGASRSARTSTAFRRRRRSRASRITIRSSKARPGHGEGHNSGEPVNITAAIVLKKIMEREKIPGTIRIWPGVAEELVGAKAYLRPRRPLQGRRRRALHARRTATWRCRGATRAGTGLVSVQYSFKGESAHAAANPWRGRSALDAVELMDVGWNFRREHLPLSQRSHYVITDGGDQPNVVPPTASVWYYFRQTTYQGIKDLWAIGDQIAQGAAMMTDVDAAADARARRGVAAALQPRDRRGHVRQHPEGRHAGVDARPIRRSRAAVQKELGATRAGARDARRRARAAGQCRRDNTGGGSDDIGDVSWNVPTVTLRYPSNIPGLPGPQLGERRSRWRRRSRTRASPPARRCRR